MQHVTLGYTDSTIEVAPATALRGKTVVGLYFGRPSCDLCEQFMLDLRHITAGCTDTAIVLVSRATTPADSKWYFGEMYDWLAVPHESARPYIGSMLADLFHIRTTPAFVLLDAAGRTLCTNGHRRLTADQTGRDFPWRDPACIHRPTVNFDLPNQARPRDLPPLPVRPHLAPQGSPPPDFCTPRPAVATPPAPTAPPVAPLAPIGRTTDVHQRTWWRRDNTSNPTKTTRRLSQRTDCNPDTVVLARPPPVPTTRRLPQRSDCKPDTVVPARLPPKPNRETTWHPTDTYRDHTDGCRHPEHIPQGKHTLLPSNGLFTSLPTKPAHT